MSGLFQFGAATSVDFLPLMAGGCSSSVQTSDGVDAPAKAVSKSIESPIYI